MGFHGFNTQKWILVIFLVLYRSKLVDSSDTSPTLTPQDGQQSGMIVMSLSPDWANATAPEASTPPENQAKPNEVAETSKPDQVKSGTPETSQPMPIVEILKVKPKAEPQDMTKQELIDLLVRYTAEIDELKSHFDYLKKTVERVSKPPKVHDHSVILNINSKMSTDLFKYSKNNDTLTYIPRDGFKFKLVRQYKEVLWHTLNRAHYSNKVDVFDLPIKVKKEGSDEEIEKYKAIIHHCDGKETEVLFAIEPEDNVYLVQLDLGVKHSTKAFVFKKNEVKHRQKYICKPEFLFIKVWNNGREVWPPPPDPQKPDETFYSNKVLIDSSSGSPMLRVFFYGTQDALDDDDENDPDYVIVPNPNMSSLHVSRPSEAAPAQIDTMAAVSSKLQPDIQLPAIPESEILDKSNHPAEIKLFVPDPSDPSKTSELRVDQYIVSKPADSVFNYYIKSGVKCNLLKCNNNDVWTHDAKFHGPKFPSWISFRYRCRILVFVSYIHIYDKLADESWTCKPLHIKLFTVDPIENFNELELNPTQYTLKDKVGSEEFSFEFNEGVKCSEVRHKDTVIWSHTQAQDGSNFPKLVHYVNNKKIKVVFDGKEILYGVDGSVIETTTTQDTQASTAPDSQKSPPDAQVPDATVLSRDKLQQSASQAPARSPAVTDQKEPASVNIELGEVSSQAKDISSQSTDSTDDDSGEDIILGEPEVAPKPKTDPAPAIQPKVVPTAPAASSGFLKPAQPAIDTDLIGVVAEGKVPDDDDVKPTAKSSMPTGSFKDVKLPKDEVDESNDSKPAEASVVKPQAPAAQSSPLPKPAQPSSQPKPAQPTASQPPAQSSSPPSSAAQPSPQPKVTQPTSQTSTPQPSRQPKAEQPKPEQPKPEQPTPQSSTSQPMAEQPTPEPKDSQPTQQPTPEPKTDQPSAQTSAAQPSSQPSPAQSTPLPKPAQPSPLPKPAQPPSQPKPAQPSALPMASQPSASEPKVESDDKAQPTESDPAASTQPAAETAVPEKTSTLEPGAFGSGIGFADVDDEDDEEE